MVPSNPSAGIPPDNPRSNFQQQAREVCFQWLMEHPQNVRTERAIVPQKKEANTVASIARKLRRAMSWKLAAVANMAAAVDG
jgi:hypothetical protein